MKTIIKIIYIIVSIILLWFLVGRYIIIEFLIEPRSLDEGFHKEIPLTNSLHISGDGVLKFVKENN